MFKIKIQFLLDNFDQGRALTLLDYKDTTASVNNVSITKSN